MEWGTVAGSGISAIGNLLGGIFGSSASSAAANNANRIAQNQFHEQMQWQKELAMSGIQMRVNDAKAAGIHPLYALGNPGMSFSPVSVGAVADNSGAITAQALSGMGQDIGRATQAALTRAERGKDLLQTEREHLLNEKLRAEIALTRSQIGPPMPTPFGNQSGMTTPPGVSAGTSVLNRTPAPYVEMVDTGNGLRPMPQKDLKVEDEFGAPLMAQWIADVQANPMHYQPSKQQIEAKWGKGAMVYWDPHRQQWMKVNPFASMPYNTYRPPSTDGAFGISP